MSEPIVHPYPSSRAIPPCRHGYLANCPACSYNAPESVMVGLPIIGKLRCACTHYCANWRNCKGGRFAAPKA